MNLTDIYRTFHPTEAEYTFFSSAFRTFSRIEQMIGYKTSINKFKKIEMTSRIFSNNNGMELEISNKRKMGKFTNM